MKTKSITSREFSIFCFSDLRAQQGERDAFAPTLWPNHTSKDEAETFAQANIKHTRYEVRPVMVSSNAPSFVYKPKPTVRQTLSAFLIGQRLPFQVVNSKTGALLTPANQTLHRFHVKRLIANRTRLELPVHPVANKIKSILG